MNLKKSLILVFAAAPLFSLGTDSDEPKSDKVLDPKPKVGFRLGADAPYGVLVGLFYERKTNYRFNVRYGLEFTDCVHLGYDGGGYQSVRDERNDCIWRTGATVDVMLYHRPQKERGANSYIFAGAGLYKIKISGERLVGEDEYGYYIHKNINDSRIAPAIYVGFGGYLSKYFAGECRISAYSINSEYRKNNFELGASASMLFRFPLYRSK